MAGAGDDKGAGVGAGGRSRGRGWGRGRVGCGGVGEEQGWVWRRRWCGYLSLHDTPTHPPTHHMAGLALPSLLLCAPAPPTAPAPPLQPSAARAVARLWQPLPPALWQERPPPPLLRRLRQRMHPQQRWTGGVLGA